MGNVPNAAPNVISTATATVTPSAPRARYAITYAGVSAITVPAPTQDGVEALFIDEGGHAHTVTCTGAGSPPTAGLNGGTTNNKLTFNGTVGSSCEVISRNGFWWAELLNGVTVS